MYYEGLLRNRTFHIRTLKHREHLESLKNTHRERVQHKIASFVLTVVVRKIHSERKRNMLEGNSKGGISLKIRTNGV
jgi:hypothetical protein